MVLCVGTKGSAPIITVSPSSQHVNLLFDFHELTLFCKAVGASSYRWERQNGDIPTSTTGIDTNALTFFNLDPKSAGNYRCVVSNDHGSKATDYATINITGKVYIILRIKCRCHWTTGLEYVVPIRHMYLQ